MGLLELFSGLFKKKKKKGRKLKDSASSKSAPSKSKSFAAKPGQKSTAKLGTKPVGKPAAKPAAKIKLDLTKYHEHAKRLEEITAEHNIGRTKSILVELTRTAYALADASTEKEAEMKDATDQLTKAVDQKDPSIAGRHASQLITLGTMMSDPILESAQETVGNAKKIEDHVYHRKPRSAKPDIAKLIERVATVEALINERTTEINQLCNKLNGALQGRDYHTVTSLSEQLSKDAAVLTLMMAGKPIELAQEQGLSVLSSGGDRLTNLKKKSTELKKATMERNYLGAMELARYISQNAALLANPNLAKANSLLEQGEKLKRALKGQDQATALSQMEEIRQTALAFRGQPQDRQKHIQEHTNKLRQEFVAKRPEGVLAAATSIWRETAVLADPTFERALTLAGQLPQIEAAIKAQDLPKALIAIESIIA